MKLRLKETIQQCILHKQLATVSAFCDRTNLVRIKRAGEINCSSLTTFRKGITHKVKVGDSKNAVERVQYRIEGDDEPINVFA
jgi:hypothetical protein